MDDARIAAHWAHRAASEERTAGLFARLAIDLEAASAERVVIELARAAIDEEHAHAAMCRAIAARHDAGAIVIANAADTPGPLPARADTEIALALRVAALSCIQETIACAWLAECFEGATVPDARDALHVMLGDETRHARLGWAHLASTRVSSATRAALSSHLPRLLRECLGPWLAPDASGSAAGSPAHGIPPDERTGEIARGTIREVVIPGFRSVGVHIADDDVLA